MPFLRRTLGAAGAGLFVLLGAAAPAHALSASELRSQLSGTHKALGSSAGALVVDLETGRTLFSRRATTPLVPASNEKLFTTAAALVRFGPQARLQTRVFVTPGTEIDENGVVDALHLVGGGDPALNDIALRALALDVGAAGVRRVRTGVLADESHLDTRRGPAGRPDPFLGGWLGGLTWAHGRPDPSLGPAQEAATRFHGLLKQRGIRLARGPRVQAIPRSALDVSLPIATVDSPPMGTLTTTTNVPSDNFYAEMLLKGLGARFGTSGSTAAGVRVMRSTLKSLDALPRANADGSGLSRRNRASAREVVALLRAMDAQPGPLRTAWMSSLAVVGSTGTLARRMRGTSAAGRCRGKTGTLTGVSALSGYCTTAGGRLVAFAFLENRVDAGRAKRLEDRMVPRIAGYSLPAAAVPEADPVDPAPPKVPEADGTGGTAAAAR